MTTEVQPYNGFAVLKDEFREIVDENFNGELDFDFSTLPTVVWPGSGGRRFIVKSGGEEREEEHITGVVVAQRKNRSLYLSGFTAGSNTPPDCSSQDGEVGRPATDESGVPLNSYGSVVFGGECKGCPFNEWESRRLVDDRYTGNGKACREGRVLLVLAPDKIRPYVMRLPSTAIQAWSNVAWDLTDRGLTLSRAILELSLEGKSGEVPVLKVKVVGEVPADDAALLKGIMPNFKRPQLAAPAEPQLSPENERLVEESPPF